MIKYVTVSLFFILCLTNTSLAATSDFTISTLVGDDVTPPTTPVILSTVPTASTQIDVSWSASTDNFLLGGYVLFRDGVQHATTTLTTYFDTGLTPETLYAYEVYAFDSTLNISTTSNSLSTTTLAVPVVITTPTTTTTDVSSSQSSTRRTILRDLTVTNTTDTSTINWQTNRPVKFTLRWGRTDSYSDGYIANDTYQVFSTTTITDLEPGTVYLYELVGITPIGIPRVLKQGQFKTKETLNIIPPPNVQRLEAVVEGDDVRLSWQLPPVASIASVRVVRNHLGYPSGLNDGAVVYDGLGTLVFDSGVLNINSPQYYSVFVTDKDGNVSSGAVVMVERSESEAGQTEIETTTTTTSTEDQTPAPDEYTEISLSGFDTNNISLSQNDEVYTFIDEQIFLLQDTSFVISIPYESLPKHLKSIVVTLLDPTNHKRSYSFLLRINKDRTAYEATIAPLNVIGISRLQIEIFDFERQVIGLYRKQVDFRASEVLHDEVIFPDKIVKIITNSLPVILSFGLLLLVLILWWLRRTEDNP